VLILFRVVLGLAVGAASLIVPLYLSEMAPTEVRGALSALNQLMIVTGILIAYLVNYALADAEAWRWMVGLALVPSLLLIGM
jgi:SP family sugar:H+ symporter-like MFS transporter